MRALAELDLEGIVVVPGEGAIGADADPRGAARLVLDGLHRAEARRDLAALAEARAAERIVLLATHARRLEELLDRRDLPERVPCGLRYETELPSYAAACERLDDAIERLVLRGTATAPTSDQVLRLLDDDVRRSLAWPRSLALALRRGLAA